MALRFCDGFDSYASGSDLTKKWASTDATWTWSPSAGRFGGGAISNNGSGGGGKLLGTKAATLSTGSNACGFYLKASAAPAATTMVCGFWDGSVYRWSVRLSTTGVALLYSSALQVTGTTNVCDNAWHWIEFDGSAAGGSALYVDNILQGSTGAGDGTVCSLLQFSSVSGVTVTIDDAVLYDSTAGAPAFANFPLNARQITTTRPASDGTVGFSATSSGSTHFNLVNEVNPDGDATYVQDGTAGDQDLLNFGALGYAPANISAVMVNVYVDNPVGGSINVQGICKSGAAAQSNAAAQATPLVYSTLQYPFPTDPNTSAAWTASGLNAAQFGYKNA